MPIPARLMTETLTRVHPVALVDPAYGTTWDYGASATRVSFAGWLEQVSTTEAHDADGNRLAERWTLITNDRELDAIDKVEWPGHPARPVVFTVEGIPEPAMRPGTGFHHLEATLVVVEG